MQNIRIWRVRKQAIELLKQGWSHRRVARYLGYNQSTISRWHKKWFLYGNKGFYNFSNKPKTAHPRTTLWENQLLVRSLRRETGMCHQRLALEIERKHGLSLNPYTIYRILKRNDLIKSKKRYQRSRKQPRMPVPSFAGALVQLDTKFLEKGRRYQYAFIDVATRYAFCVVSSRLKQKTAIEALKEAQRQLPFKISMIQTDNGLEFQGEFRKACFKLGINHRYIRVRAPRHNGYVERLHRTIDQEFWWEQDLKEPVTILNQKLRVYLTYYLTERVHLGLSGKTPKEALEVMQN